MLEFIPKPYGRERGVALVDIDRVMCIAAVPEGSELHLEGGRTELHAKPLARLLPLLPPHLDRQSGGREDAAQRARQSQLARTRKRARAG